MHNLTLWTCEGPSILGPGIKDLCVGTKIWTFVMGPYFMPVKGPKFGPVKGRLVEDKKTNAIWSLCLK